MKSEPDWGRPPTGATLRTSIWSAGPNVRGEMNRDALHVGLRANLLLFPQISTILSNPTPPANPFPPPTCTPPSQFATFIRITNKLSLTGINLPATLSFELDDPSSPRECGGLPCLPRASRGASRGASKGLFTQCGAEGPPLFPLPHPIYPVYREL